MLSSPVRFFGSGMRVTICSAFEIGGFSMVQCIIVEFIVKIGEHWGRGENFALLSFFFIEILSRTATFDTGAEVEASCDVVG